ncbi:hypothetical protein [Yoonia sp. 208BN28-4]|uniref:hypothetical protein n=1 Tax=Yoonia sp. 208BN28-4 TaxID=3126505 RepID=UPI0030AF0433
MTAPVRIFRWIVFLLAAFYCVRTLIFGNFSEFGGPFRYLTIWALILSFFAASRMMALVEDRSERRWDGFVCAVAVVNAMVVFLYWRLYFADPTSVTRDGELGQFYLEMYLHGLGPALQIIDTIFVHRSYRRLTAPLAWLFGIIGTYILWGELLVQRFNDSPMGEVTSGLPYPFLNDLALNGRMVFYGVNFATAVVLLLVFAGIAWAFRKINPAPEAP